ncbi:MAG: hypothetical protein M3P48_01270, partial [Actinomycetota bacterium]|nr:hypothetical protein [Actinomycetota bacterium]
MPTRLLLEGSDIEELLSRVREEHGPTARIVHADRVRVGGVGGFFAKERFEVAVEVEDMLPGAGSDESPERTAPARVVRPFQPPQVSPPAWAATFTADDPLSALIGAAELAEHDSVEMSSAPGAVAPALRPPAPAAPPAP